MVSVGGGVSVAVGRLAGVAVAVGTGVLVKIGIDVGEGGIGVANSGCLVDSETGAGVCVAMITG